MDRSTELSLSVHVVVERLEATRLVPIGESNTSYGIGAIHGILFSSYVLCTSYARASWVDLKPAKWTEGSKLRSMA